MKQKQFSFEENIESLETGQVTQHLKKDQNMIPLLIFSISKTDNNINFYYILLATDKYNFTIFLFSDSLEIMEPEQSVLVTCTLT